MPRNPILEEVYAARKKLLADAGGDVHKYLEGVREREANSDCLLKPAPQIIAGVAKAANDDVASGQSSSTS